MEKNYIAEIQSEYRRIDNKWLNLHYKTSAVLVLFSIFVECLVGVIMCNSDALSTTIPMFILKLFVIPCSLILSFLFVDYVAMNSKHLSQTAKIYIVSLIFVLICFVLFTIHIVFSALYFIFVVAILLTTIYADYLLTSITATLSIISLIISELFIKWDIDKVSIFTNAIRLGDFIIAIFLLLGFSAVCMIVIYYEREKNAASIQKERERYELEQKLKIDDLTGIYNRTAFRDEIRNMAEDDTENSYVFAMIDIDNFKNINDNLGHVIGDLCLIEFAKILTTNCGTALPFRFGGDEFCILFKNSTLDNIIEICEKIQHDFSKLELTKNDALALTASFGIAHHIKDMTISELVVNTDKALYEAKTVKNSIRIFSE